MRLFLFVGAVACLFAQQNTTFSTDVNVVNIFASVHNKQAKVVTNLTKDDFTLSEDDRPQTIRYFSRETDLPLTLGLLVDTSLSQRDVLDEEKSASYRFLDQVLRPEKDKTFVIHFDHETELLQDLTASHDDLQKALDAVKLPDDARPQMRGGQTPGPLPRRAGGAGTTLYDSIFLASDELMSKQQGRKALVLLTDGVDQGSKESLYGSVSAAQRAGTLVYSIWFTGKEASAQRSVFSPGGMGGGGRGGRRGGGGMGGGGMGRGGGGGGPAAAQRPDGKKILQQISRETGGAYFEVTKKETISDIYTRIEEDLRNQYSIGYVSDRPDGGAAFRHITLAAKKSGMTIQAPEGYYPKQQPPQQQPAQPQQHP